MVLQPLLGDLEQSSNVLFQPLHLASFDQLVQWLRHGLQPNTLKIIETPLDLPFSAFNM